MAGILCDQGIAALNQLLTAAMQSANYMMALFTNNHTPTTSDTLSDYTEATFGGYAQQPLGGAFSGGTSGHIQTQTFEACVFTPTGSGLPETIYGYYVTDGFVLIGAELFAVPITLSTTGISITVNESLSYQDRTIS